MIGTIKADLQILLQMLRGRSRRGSHQQQLEHFYGPQAGNYDAFRERLLHGRRELVTRMGILPEQSIVELGAGTGQNLRYLGYPLQLFEKVDVVDLCPALLDIARQHYQHLDNIHAIEADATTYKPDSPVDRVYFSYALTMIPDWKKAINNALGMLKPGGLFGVVDFYISADTVTGDQVRHGYIARKFWQGWFAHDGVYLVPDHLDYLRSVCRIVYVQELRGSVPYLPFLKAPYYIYVGQKESDLSRA